MSCTTNLWGGEFLSSSAEIDISHSEPGKYSCLSRDENFGVSSSEAESPFQTQNLDMWALVGLFV